MAEYNYWRWYDAINFEALNFNSNKINNNGRSAESLDANMLTLHCYCRELLSPWSIKQMSLAKIRQRRRVDGLLLFQ